MKPGLTAVMVLPPAPGPAGAAACNCLRPQLPEATGGRPAGPARGLAAAAAEAARPASAAPPGPLPCQDVPVTQSHAWTDSWCRGGGSALSLWSKDSVLSIGSVGSVLSIGSVGSVLSVGSVGCALSAASIGSSLSVLSAASWLSTGSLLSARSCWSVLSWRSRDGFMAAGVAAAAAGTGLALYFAARRGS